MFWNWSCLFIHLRSYFEVWFCELLLVPWVLEWIDLQMLLYLILPHRPEPQWRKLQWHQSGRIMALEYLDSFILTKMVSVFHQVFEHDLIKYFIKRISSMVIMLLKKPTNLYTVYCRVANKHAERFVIKTFILLLN